MPSKKLARQTKKKTQSAKKKTQSAKKRKQDEEQPDEKTFISGVRITSHLKLVFNVAMQLLQTCYIIAQQINTSWSWLIKQTR